MELRQAVSRAAHTAELAPVSMRTSGSAARIVPQLMPKVLAAKEQHVQVSKHATTPSTVLELSE